jgi:N-acetylglucosamine kinase-like BadF-type ATPase
MQYFAGFDVGSTKTHALIADANGRCMGLGQAGGGNYQAVGYQGLRAALRASLDQALQMADLAKEQIAAAGFGVAGYDFPSDRPGHLEAIATLGLSCPVEVMNDGLNGLLAGATHGVGVNVTAGSSNNCRGRNADGKEGRVVGNGTMFGEFGGAMEIVQRGLHLVNYAWIRRRPATALTAIYLDAVGAEDEMDLMEGLSNDRYQLPNALARRISETACAGDPAAQEVLAWAGEELGWLAVAVARQLGMDDEMVEVVQSGSVFDAGPAIIAPMREVVRRHCPQARLIRLEGLPVIGAVILAMEQVHHEGYAVRDLLKRTTLGAWGQSS